MSSTQHKEGKIKLHNDIKEAIKSIIITAYDDGIKYGRNNTYGIKGGSSYFDKYGNRLLERLPFTPPTGNERTAQDCTDGKAEHEGGELDKKNPNYIHNLFMRNADVWTDEHGWMMRIDRFKEVARQLNNLLNF